MLNSYYLTEKERTRLYMFHELGHVVNREWMDAVTKYLARVKEDSSIKMLMHLGVIKNASYALFGYSDSKYIKMSEESKKSLIK